MGEAEAVCVAARALITVHQLRQTENRYGHGSRFGMVWEAMLASVPLCARPSSLLQTTFLPKPPLIGALEEGA